jgi:ABC-2 type transport system permease protein
MSTNTATAAPGHVPAATQRAYGVTFIRVLHAEWIKYWSLRSTVWTVGATVVVMAAVSWLAVFFTAREASTPTPSRRTAPH